MSENFTHTNDDLLVKYLLGEATEEEAEAVRTWLSASIDNQQYYDQLRAIWEHSQLLAAGKPVNEDAAWSRFRQRIHQGRPVRRFGWLRIAALFILIAGLAAAIYFTSSTNSVQQLTVQANHTPLTDTLPDGSVITLNANAILSYPEKFKGHERMVALKGEAFFNITPNQQKPFIITASDVTIKVVGTSFNVKNMLDSVEVIVSTGRVQVTKGEKMIELAAGEKTVIRNNDQQWVKEKEQETLYNYYHTREFVCDDTPLWKLVQVLNEAYKVNIVFGRSELRNLPLTTTFSNESLDQVLDIISATFNISVEKTGDTIVLR